MITRRKKCDEMVPSCTDCLRLGQDCIRGTTKDIGYNASPLPARFKSKMSEEIEKSQQGQLSEIWETGVMDLQPELGERRKASTREKR